jgi:hypothetical protein
MGNPVAPMVPCSTPVTPPNLDFLEKAFSKLGSTGIGSRESGSGNITTTLRSSNTNFNNF